MRRTNAQRLVLLGTTAAAVVGVASTAIGVPPPAITAKGVDGVKLGMTHKKLRNKGLVGKIRKGCELGGPNTRSARLLSAPFGVKGTVNYTLKKPRKVTDAAGGCASG